jgi:Phage terminase large subunit (GpA)
MTQVATQPEILTPEDLAGLSPGYWAAELYKINLPGEKFSLTVESGRNSQKESMDSLHRRICYMKATQWGATLIECLKELWGMINGLYPKGVMVLFPTTDDVLTFSKSRFKPLIDSNRLAIGQYVKPGGKGTDSASLKQIGKPGRQSMLYLHGARLTDGESAKLRSSAVDRVRFEECDLYDEESIGLALARMADSKVKQEVYASNPTTWGRGSGKRFLLGDQRHWHVRCACGHWVCAEDTFPDCVKTDVNGRGFIGCPKCGRDAGPSAHRPGQWVPKVPANSGYMASYRISHLMLPHIDPTEVLADFMNPPDGNIDNVYRHRLGLAHVSAQDKLQPERIFDCCGADNQLAGHPGPCAMGVDVMKMKYAVIGFKSGTDRYEIVRLARVSGWNDVHDLAKRYNVKSCVIDAMPDIDAVRDFQKAEPYKIFLCQYTESSIQNVDFNQDSGIVKANRTQTLDQTHRMFMDRKYRLPRRDAEVNLFAEQCCNTAKLLERNKKTGAEVYRYVDDGGPDHYRHALNYFTLAASGNRIVRPMGFNQNQEHARAKMSPGIGVN